MENKNNNTNYYTPKDIVNLVSSNLPRPYIAVIGNITTKKGYPKITDDDVDINITFNNINNNINYQDYQDGSKVEVFGYLNYQITKGGIYPNINVDRIRFINFTAGEDRNKVEEIIRKKTNRGFTGYISFVAKQENINILLIHGQGAQVHRDFENAFTSSIGPYRDRVKLEFVETKLNDDDLSETLRKIDTSKYHLVFIIRGGGSQQELSRIGGIKTMTVIVEKDIPLYLALGHSLDKGVSLLEKVADYSFSTPSIAGQETGRLLRLYLEEEELRKQNEKLRQDLIAFQTQIKHKEERFIKDLEEKIKNLQSRLNEKETNINNLYQQISKKDELINNLKRFTTSKELEIGSLLDVNKRLQNEVKLLKDRQNILHILIILLAVFLIFSVFAK